MTVKSVKEAWAAADEIFPTDYMKDERASANAGYNVFRSTADGHYYDYICDLGDRLEINLMDGRTINIWIDAPKYKEYQLADALATINNAIYEIDDMVNSDLAKETGIREARDTLYGAYAKIRDILDRVNPDSTLYRTYNLNEA